MSVNATLLTRLKQRRKDFEKAFLTQIVTVMNRVQIDTPLESFEWKYQEGISFKAGIELRTSRESRSNERKTVNNSVEYIIKFPSTVNIVETDVIRFTVNGVVTYYDVKSPYEETEPQAVLKRAIIQKRSDDIVLA